MTSSLSIIIPVYNERDQLPVTITAAALAVEDANGAFDATFVIVDDGSVDGSAEAAQSTPTSLPIRVVSLKQNSGRYAARLAGLRAAESDLVLFLDTGVLLGADALRFVAREVAEGRVVWNGHAHLDADGALARFWGVVNELAFWDYLQDPHTTSYGEAEFDRYPKGLGCFLAPKELLEQSFAQFQPHYSDTRDANDDGPILRAVAQRRPIWISPEFDCTYRPRTSVTAFARHAFHRGVVFLDGHGRRESRFFPIVAVFYPLSLAALIVAVRRPVAVLPLGAVVIAGAAVAAASRHRPPRDIASFAVVAPLYAVAHGLGMWRGLGLATATRLRRLRG